MFTWAPLLWLALAAGDPPAASKFRPVTLTGTVVEMPGALKDLGIGADAEPVAQQVALKGDDGTLTPLLSDEASRALFHDERLRHRKTEIQGRKYPGLPYVQVLSFKVEDQGKLRTPEYYCEVCAISVRAPKVCPCCQGPMVLRMKPEEP
jgi:hypothetical protein